ncbi:MAG: hypothetical protein WBA28_04625 [Microbacteriaceae bacterium]
MKASPKEQYKLVNLQQIDLRLMRISNDLKGLEVNPELVAARAELVRVRAQITDAVHHLEDAQSDLNKLESDVKLVDDRLDRDAKLLAGSLSAKETQSIEAEVLSLTVRKGNLEDIQLELMQQLENAQQAHAELLVVEQQVLTEIARFGNDQGGAQNELETERAEVEAAREMQVSGLIPELYELYERQRQRYGFGATELRGKLSTMAGVDLSTEDVAMILQTDLDEVVLCPESQAILIRNTPSGGAAE